MRGKNVVDTGAKIIGTVSDIEFDPAKWKAIDLHVELTDETIETLGYKKPYFGHVGILFSIKKVKAVADIVSLKKGIEELKDFIGPPKRATT